VNQSEGKGRTGKEIEPQWVGVLDLCVSSCFVLCGAGYPILLGYGWNKGKDIF
jgi:hypothetical protein